jgi:rubrerythrin
VARRLSDLGEGGPGVVETGVGAIESLVGQVAALGKAPLDIVRGEGGEEKLLKNAKDECATEALEIATYESLATLARHVADTKTADLADRIRGEEERMLEQLRNLLPSLTEAAANAEIVEPSYDISTTGAADAARQAVGSSRQAVESTRRRLVEAARTGINQVTDAARDAMDQLTEAAQRGRRRLRRPPARRSPASRRPPSKRSRRCDRPLRQLGRAPARRPLRPSSRPPPRLARAQTAPSRGPATTSKAWTRLTSASPTPTRSLLVVCVTTSGATRSARWCSSGRGRRRLELMAP